MFYGLVSPRSFVDKNVLNRLQKAIQWNEGELHEIQYRNFSGGLFLDPRLPHTLLDCLHLDTGNELLVLMHGSIYNRADLHRACQLTGNDVTDPALVAHLFLAHGPDMVTRLNGDFAIVIYQARHNAVYLFRDHFGNVPVVYTTVEQSLFFSTDTLALCRTFQGKNRIRIAPLIANYKPVDLTLTPNDQVLMLKPGHWFQMCEGAVTVTKYWYPERIKTDDSLTREQLLGEMKTLLTDAVQSRADQRFTAGAHLSGGLDSSLVSVMTRPHYAHQPTFYGYSWTPANAPVIEGQPDERVLIRQVGEMANITPAFIHVEPRDLIAGAQNSLHNYMYFYEEKVLQLANRHKTNLLFSGWGGDEFVTLTSMGIDSDLVFRGNWKAFFTKNPLSDPMKIIKYLIFRVFLPAIGYVRPSLVKEYHDCMSFIRKEYRQFPKKDLNTFNVYRSRRGFHLNMIYNYHIAERTGPWCVTGFKSGVVYRYPLLDVRLIEYMLKVPSRLLVDRQYTRIIARQLSEGLLPDSVRCQKSKNDPARFALIEQQTKERGLLFIGEVADFKANTNLYFIDFDHLEQVIRDYKAGVQHKDEANLFGELVHVKFLHELTKSYQQEIV